MKKTHKKAVKKNLFLKCSEKKKKHFGKRCEKKTILENAVKKKHFGERREKKLFH